MNGPKAVAWVERLIWTLIYGGLFTAVIGLATESRDETLGWSLVIVGGVVAAAGAVLIWFRSRMTDRG